MKRLRVKKIGVAAAAVIVLVVAVGVYVQVRYGVVAWGDIPTWGLLAGAVVTAVYAARAFGKQSDELAEQRKLTSEQIGVLELQRRELEESTAQREREAGERRAAQAAMVTTWFGSSRQESTLYSGSSAPVVTPQGVAWGAHIRNASHLPVFQVQVFFHYVQEQGADWTSADRGGPPERIRVIPPGADRFVEIPDAVRKMIDQCDDQVYVTSIEFTDAAGVRWMRDPRGGLAQMA